MESVFRFRLILKLLLALFLFLHALTLVPLIICIFFPLRLFVQLCARFFRPDLKNLLKCPSSIMAYEDILNKPKLNVYICMVYDGPIALDHLRSIFEERVIQKLNPSSENPSSRGRNNPKDLMYPELKQYWTTFLNYTFWKQDENFDLKNHVRLYDYSNNCNTAGDILFEESVRKENENDFNVDSLSFLLEKPWKERQSPWELLMVPNFKSSQEKPSKPNKNENSHEKSCTLLIFRMHHAMGDGYSVLKLLERDMMLGPQKNPTVKLTKITSWTQVAFSACLPFKIPWDLAGSIIDSIEGAHSWHGWGRDHKLSRKVLTGLSKAINMDLIKDVKNKFGVSYNAVLCSVVASCCQRLMEDAGQKVPGEMACLIPLPLAGHPDGLVNHVTCHIVKWPMDPSLTREERLRILSKRVSPSKYFSAPMGFNLLNKIGHLVPNIFFNIRALSPYSLVLTSFPGPQESVTFHGLGVNMTDLFAGLGPGTGTVGTLFCLISMKDKQRFTMNIDKKLFPDEKIFQNFANYIEEELGELWQRNSMVKDPYIV